MVIFWDNIKKTGILDGVKITKKPDIDLDFKTLIISENVRQIMKDKKLENINDLDFEKVLEWYKKEMIFKI